MTIKKPRNVTKITIPLSDSEKMIYNLWLRAIATASNRPYRKRENFDAIQQETQLSLQKLDAFLERNKRIDIFDYFSSILKYYEEEHLPLDFFCSSQASTAFFRQKKSEIFRIRSEEELIEESKQAMRIIAEYCIEKNIRYDEYISYKEENATFPAWLNHVREDKYFPLPLYMFPSFKITYEEIPDDMLRFILGEERKKFLENLEIRCNMTTVNKLKNIHTKLQTL